MRKRHPQPTGRPLRTAVTALLVLAGLGLRPALGTEPGDILRVGLYENRPKIYTTDEGRVSGFFPALLEHIAQAEGWRLEYRPGTWQECLERLKSGEIALMMDVAWTAERQALYAFNEETVLISWGEIYTRPDLKVQSVFDLAGKRIAVMTGSVYAQGEASIRHLMGQFNLAADYLEYPSYREVFQAVAAREADAGAVNNIFGMTYEKDFHVLRSPVLFGPARLHFAMARGDPAARRILPVLDARLRALKADPHSFYYQALDEHLHGSARKPPALSDWSAMLTDAERAWIRDHPDIRLGVDPEFYPFEFVGAKGDYQGIASDYVRLFRERLGLNLRILKNLSWTDAVAHMRAGTVDVLPCVGFTEDRAGYALFTRPYIRFQRVILTRTDMPFLAGIADLEALSVGVQAGTSHEGFLTEQTPIKPVLYGSLQECLLALSAGKVDAAVANLASAAYWIRKLNLINLKMAAPASPEPATLHFAVRKDWPELASILNKGLDLVTAEEQRTIEHRWVAVEYKPGIEPKVAWRIGLRLAAGVALVLALILAWTYRLKQENRRRRSAEEALERYATELAAARDRAESADRVKSAFLATMSHELRTPLNSIIGFTGILLQGLPGPLNPEQLKQLRMVKDSGQHLLALINDVLDISKIEAGQFTLNLAPFDLADSIRKVVDTVAPLAEKKNLPLILRLPPDPPRLASDRRRVEQILLNLLSNAIKFTEKGRVTLEVEALSAARPPAVRLAVADTGPGIPREHLDKLFQPFRQLDTGLARQHEGTGLGLAISKRLAERLGGAITVESEPGRGSVFRLTLPLETKGPP